LVESESEAMYGSIGVGERSFETYAAMSQCFKLCLDSVLFVTESPPQPLADFFWS
jgi:hypothetical protein